MYKARANIRNLHDVSTTRETTCLRSNLNNMVSIPERVYLQSTTIDKYFIARTLLCGWIFFCTQVSTSLYKTSICAALHKESSNAHRFCKCISLILPWIAASPRFVGFTCECSLPVPAPIIAGWAGAM